MLARCNALYGTVLHLMEDVIIPFILALTNDSTLRGEETTRTCGKELVRKRSKFYLIHEKEV